MKVRYLNHLLVLISALCFSSQVTFGQGADCLGAEPFCTGSPITFPAGINNGTGQAGPDYGCLLTTPNPAWYYMEMATNGNLDIEITNSNGEDIDFILYGPFVDQTSPCTALLTAGNTEDCSYSTSATEIANIVGGIAGEFYLMMITNFSNNTTDITFADLPSSTATTNCAIVCPTVEFGVWNGTTVEQTPLTQDCDDASVLLLADEDGFNPGVAISPCIVIQVFPTNANATLSVEFFEGGTSLGTLVPTPSTNWSGFLSLADPTATHAYVLNEGAGTGVNMTYNVLDCHTGTVLASGTWVDDGNPQTVTVTPPPNLSGTAGYTVTPPAGAAGLTSFGWGGAVWDPSAVPPGSYDITYSWNDGAGNCSGTSMHTFIVTNPNTSVFSYSAASYCQSDTDPTPTNTGTGGGTYSSSPGGLAINASTGAIDVSASGPGVYTVSYFVGTALPSSCNASSSVNVTIVADQSAAFSYANTVFCQSDTDPTPTITGDGGGTFSGTGGLSINGSTGVIDLSNSSTGGHTITYTSPGPCPASTTFNITINAADAATIAYSSATYCQSDADPSPIITGTAGGAFTAPAQVSINGSTGAIDLSASTAGGPYTITYTTGGACPITTTFNITIQVDQSAAFSYASAVFCAGDADPSATITGDAGGTFSGTGGLVVNSGNGTVDLSASSAGAHTVTYTTAGPCAATATFNITINAEDDPSFTYASATFCQGAADPSPTVTGTGGGTFSGPAQIAINPTTGLIDLSASTVGGPYTITYTTPGPACPNSTTFAITIQADQDASFSYSSATFCAGDADPTPTITGTAGGTFTGTGGLTINGGSGTIDLDASSAGAHTVTYTTAGPCAASATFNLVINAEDDPAFSYSSATYCESDANPTPTVTGTAGGTFTGPAQVSINGGTGTIDLANSAVGGPYTITYTTPGPNCPNSTTFAITILPDQDASFAYSSTTYCAGDADPTPTITGTAGGTFSGTAGLSINTGTGVIDLDAGTTGAHMVTYTTAGPCPASTTFNVTINPEDNPAFSYTGNVFCSNGIDPTPTVSGTSGGTYASTPGLTINAANGTVDLDASTAGAYTITYTTPGPACPNSATFSITINQAQDSTFAYSGGTYCLTGTDPTPIISGTAGGSFTATGGLVINPTTGAIDLDASGVNTYAVTYTTPGPNCPTSMTVNITITNAPSAVFSYAGPYCEGDPAGASPTFGAGSSAGTFTFTVNSGGPNLDINASTGDINLQNSDGGTYTVTNDIAASGGCAAANSTASVTITAQDDPGFTLTSPVCQGDSVAFPIITGTAGGTFSEATGNVVFNNTTTGEMDLINTPAGAYTIQYLTNGTCIDSSNVVLIINIDDDPTFSYSAPSFCMNATDPLPTVSGTAGGAFSSIPVGLSLDPLSGAIDLDASVGSTTYTITYTTPGPNCIEQSSVTLTVDSLDNPLFNYSQTAYCTGDPNQFPTITGTLGGTFVSIPVGLDLNPTTGEVNVGNSPVGNFTVMYVTNGACPDSSNFPFAITNALDATIFASGPYCSNDGVVTLAAANGGGVWSGPGITDATNGTFDPALASIGTNAIVYIIAGSCGDIDTLMITVNQASDPSITNAPSNVCEGSGSIDLNATDEIGTWTGPGITDAATGAWDPTVAGGAGSYTVYHTISAACGGVDSATIVVDPIPGAPVGVDVVICSGDPAPTLQVVGGSGVFTWYDDAQGTNQVGTGSSYTPTVTAIGVYTYYVSETLGNCEGPLTPLTLTIGGPTANFIPTPDNGFIPLDVYFDNLSTNGSTYAWDFGNGDVSSQFDPLYTYTEFGDYTASLVVTDINGCFDTYSLNIHVEAESTIIVPNVFSPNNDGINDLFRVDAENLTAMDMTISNRWGQVVSTVNTTSGGWDGFTLSGMESPEGTYFYIISATGADGTVYNFTGTLTLVR